MLHTPFKQNKKAVEAEATATATAAEVETEITATATEMVYFGLNVECGGEMTMRRRSYKAC